MTTGGGWATLRRFGRNRLAVAGAVFLALLLAACFLGSRWAPDPNVQRLDEPISGPSLRHWFGTDQISRDVLARVLRGGQFSLRLALGVAVISTALGTALGAVAGFFGGRMDSVLMRLVDLVLTIPLLPVLAVAASQERLGPLRPGSPLGVTLVLSLLVWTPIARVVRGVARSLRREEFVEAARALGASDTHIVLRHIVPNASGPIVVNATLLVASAVLLESTLSFLGFGVNPPTATWGAMLSGSVSTMELYPWLVVFPGLAIFSTVLAVSFVGDGLRDALDPTHPTSRAPAPSGTSRLRHI